MKLGFCGSSANGTEGDEISQELGRDRVEHLTGDGHAEAGEVCVEFPGDFKAFVDFVGFVDVRVVDETFPADRRPWLFQVGSHNDAEVRGKLLSERLQTASVFQRGCRVMDGTWSNHNQKSVISLVDDLDTFLSASVHRLDRGLALSRYEPIGNLAGHGVLYRRELGLEESRRNKRVVA